MKNELVKLRALAQMDAEIDAMKDEHQRLPTDIEELKNQLQTTDSEFNEKKSAVNSLKSEIRQKESSLAEQKGWITEREEKVKEIKTIKEYQAVLKEIAKSKKDIADLEAQLLTLMAQFEEESTKLSEMEISLKSQEETIVKQIEEKNSSLKSNEAKTSDKLRARMECEKELIDSTLKRYNMIKTRLSPAIAMASSNGVCQECNVNIPPQLFIELQKLKQIVNCPRCHRILCLTE